MKSLYLYLEDLFATPLNTTGTGNVAAPAMDNSEVGSGDIILSFKPKKIKKIKKLKHIVEGKVDKQKQLDIILKNNPANDKDMPGHTWIRELKDILTFEEALDDAGYDENDDLTPDFKAADLKKALKTRKITVYSSYNIKPGTFVTPSKMEAQNYAGSSKVYFKTVNLEDVAWIDPFQGQYAKI